MEFPASTHQTYAQLIASGFSDAEIESQVRAGQLTRLRRGAYAAAEVLDPEGEHLRLIAATMPEVHPDNVLSHESAAVLHGLPVPKEALQAVTMIRRTSGHGDRSPRLRVRNTRLTEQEVTSVGGLPVTTVARTAMDVARVQTYPWAVAACDAALRQGLPRDELLAAGMTHPRLRGLPRARRAAQFADGRSESPIESLSRVQFARHGIPAPELQYEIFDHDGVFVARCDFGWPEFRLVGECDGQIKYGRLLGPGQTPESAVMMEKRRENAIRDVGYWVLRWDWDLALRGEQLATRLRRAMAAQRRR